MPGEQNENRLHSRREVIRLGAQGVLGAAGAFALAGIASQRSWALKPGSLVLTPEETEGPYFVDERLKRSDIRIDPADKTMQSGHPLQLGINIAQVVQGVVSPVAGAQVDIWHCNALGLYSDVQQQRTVGRKFLRGYQVSDKNGDVAFTTVYPGWYNGRTVHIHVKVRLTAANKSAYDFTTQFYFDDVLTDKIYNQAPYSQRGRRDTRNDADGIFRGGPGGASAKGSEGGLLTLKLQDDASHSVGKFNIVLDPTQPHRRGPGSPGGPGGPRGFGPPPGGFGPPPGGPPPGGFGPPPGGY
jgi:protocatechuate 3,4-dioxygenase beta subunit